jgi:hypothetical protein
VRTKSPISRASVGNCPNLGINPAMSRPSSSVGRRKWTRNAQQVRGGFAAQSAIALPRAPGRFIDALDRCRGVPVLRRVCRSRWRQLITFEGMMPHVCSHGHWLQCRVNMSICAATPEFSALGWCARRSSAYRRKQAQFLSCALRAE